MTGLRERKKEATAKRILDVASEMFRKGGYEAARIEDIAAKADLSVATFYNYFGSKADILLATVVAETEHVLAAGEACISAPHDTALDAFDALVHSYYSNSFVYTSPEMWRIAVARTMLHPDAEFSRRYFESDVRFTKQVCRFIRKMQAIGLIRSDIEPEPIAELLMNNVDMNFKAYMRSNELIADDFRRAVKRQSASLFREISCRAAVDGKADDAAGS